MDTGTGIGSGTSTVINPGGDITSAVGWGYTFFIENYAISNLYKPLTIHFRRGANNQTSGWGAWNNTNAINSLTIVNTDAVSYTAGTYILYGVN